MHDQSRTSPTSPVTPALRGRRFANHAQSSSSPTLPLLRLLQLADSSFPTGGFAYSHGLEWLAARRLVTGEPDIHALLRAYVSQVAVGQWLPAARAAFEAPNIRGVVRADIRLDASIPAETERAAARAMGERLLTVAAEAFPSDRVRALLGAVQSGDSPGHFPIAFAVACRDAGLDLAGSLAGLGFTMITSITQAAIRLGVIGQAAAARLVATSSEHLDDVIASVISGPQRRTYGAFTPGLEVATLLQPTLTFRMFAS